MICFECQFFKKETEDCLKGVPIFVMRELDNCRLFQKKEGEEDEQTSRSEKPERH